MQPHTLLRISLLLGFEPAAEVILQMLKTVKPLFDLLSFHHSCSCFVRAAGSHVYMFVLKGTNKIWLFVQQ